MTKRIFPKMFLLVALAFSSANEMYSQVTIGADSPPQSFSVLELFSNTSMGMRLPQMTQLQRDTLDGTQSSTAGISAGMAAARTDFGNQKTGKAMGLQIFNTTTLCVETWNGAEWIMACGVSYINTIPDTQGGDDWASTKWTGAFWRDNEKGERIIASKGVAGQPWTATVDAPCDWLVLAANGGSDPKLWTDNPGNAEGYQVMGNATTVSGTGNILFRIGCTGVNPNVDASYDTNKKPRYAKVLVSVNGAAADTIFCRQGESADYVFGPGDGINGGTAANNRNDAAKFSPYNLTASTLTDASPDLGVQVAVRGGVFVAYPTQAGAHWQWGTDISKTATYNNTLRHAYHPVKPIGMISGWDDSNTYPAAGSGGAWQDYTGADRLETCPSGWRRPTAGDTVTLHYDQPASGSELMQSLFSTAFDGPSSNLNSANYRYWGYYADGFFDRRPIVTSTGSPVLKNSAVSVTTRDVAYIIGTLFTNPVTGASLFTPAGGHRHFFDGTLNFAGYVGYYWSSSAYNEDFVWMWSIEDIYAHHINTSRTNGFAVRCVRD